PIGVRFGPGRWRSGGSPRRESRSPGGGGRFARSALTSSHGTTPSLLRFCPQATLSAFPLPGRFEGLLETFHHLRAVGFALGGGNLSLQTLNWVRARGCQRLFNLFPDRAEFLGSDHNNHSNRSHNAWS